MNTYSVSRKFFLPDFEFQKTLIFLKCYNVGNMLTSTKFWTRIRNKYFYSKRNQTVYHDTVVIIFGLWKAVFRYNVNRHIFFKKGNLKNFFFFRIWVGKKFWDLNDLFVVWDVVFHHAILIIHKYIYFKNICF